VFKTQPVQFCKAFPMAYPAVSYQLARPDDRGVHMGTAAKLRRENRTITVNFRDEATHFGLITNGKAFLECVLAFILSIGFQLQHKATCRGGGYLTRHSHYVRVCLGGPPSGVFNAPRAKQCSPSSRISSCVIASCPPFGKGG
jgi:hypothetical protein